MLGEKLTAGNLQKVNASNSAASKMLAQGL
jgi:hypothetical protein